MKRALLLVIPILAGCSAAGQAGAGAASPSPSGDRMAPYRALAQCLREHGAPNYPDPTMDPQGNVDIKKGGSQAPPHSAQIACEDLAAKLPAPKRRSPFTAEDIANLRKLAQCARQHGISDWPDPDADGRFRLNQRLSQLGKKAMEPVEKNCGQYFPKNKGIVISQVGS
jgi:hypothetical protein